MINIRYHLVSSWYQFGIITGIIVWYHTPLIYKGVIPDTMIPMLILIPSGICKGFKIKVAQLFYGIHIAFNGVQTMLAGRHMSWNAVADGYIIQRVDGYANEFKSKHCDKINLNVKEI